jgi:D-alanyl-D-alanine carboxypeptidase (penicillin-binding protein 5/6)
MRCVGVFLIRGSLLGLIWLSFCTPSECFAAQEQLSIHAEAAVLIDVKSRRILWEKKSEKPLRIASLTKIMTAIVAIEQGQLSDRVIVSDRAYGKTGSSLYLKQGEEMSLHHMLYGLMLRSGNDAATAIAEHIGGSVEGFSSLMNDKARWLGMSHSHFSNPSGLDEEGSHYASARDLAILTAHALKNPVFQDIVKTKHKKVANPHESWDYTWINKNKMLFLFPGADGVKTGYTKLAKRCLVSSATHQGQQLAVVTLNDAQDWADHKTLLQYGFEHYPTTTIANELLDSQDNRWIEGEPFSYPLTKEEWKLVTQQLVTHETHSIAYKLGEYGYVQFSLHGQVIGTLLLKQQLESKPSVASYRNLHTWKRNIQNVFKIFS